MSEVASRLVSASQLTSRERGDMLALLSTYFAGATPERFEHDLSEKNWALLIERAGELVGFTTLLAYETDTPEGPASVVYSGDTIVSPSAWNTAALPRAWIEAVAALRKSFPNGAYYWLLITSGFRTYRLLPVFWREFYPHYETPTPPGRQRLLDHLARERFGGRYNPSTSVVRLDHPQPLQGDLAGIPAGRLVDPHVAYFARRNPGYVAGDELVCLTELSPANLTAAGRRMAASVPTW